MKQHYSDMRAMKQRSRRSDNNALAKYSPILVLEVRVYLDHQNFYYNVSRVYKREWIDLVALYECVLQDHFQRQHPLLQVRVNVEKLFVYAAKLKGEDGANQEIYFNALKEYSGGRAEFEYGQVVEKEKRGYLTGKDADGQNREFKTREEKQTNLNMGIDITEAAVSNFYSASRRTYDLVCVSTNDGDFRKVFVMLMRHKQRYCLVSPRKEQGKGQPVAKVLKELVRKENRIPHITQKQIEMSLLPTLVEKHRCPKNWK